MDQIECDFVLFGNMAKSLNSSASREDKLNLLTIYTGEYLSDFEALWATVKRIKYNDIYEAAVKSCR